ncbi:MAG TPA: DUF3575 domain-containing protein [Dyadobacter sp.]|jgi:hypothetical protein|nr:DUF3575 domain-containing protein [Dyadobacter sp.]
MRIILVVAILGSLMSPPVSGQVDPEESRKHVILKWSPLSMYDIDNTVQFGVEVPLPDSRFTIQQEIGYGHGSFNLWYIGRENRPDKNTIKARTQLRFYFIERTRFRAYVAGEYLYKRVVNQKQDWTGRECTVPGGCSFFENMNVKQGRFVNAVHAKAGWHFYFSNRISLDLHTGMGFRQSKLRMITPGVQNRNLESDWLFGNTDFTSGDVIPSLSVGFQVGIALGKFQKPYQLPGP